MKSSTTKLTPQPDKLQGQFCSLEGGSGSHRRSIRHRSAVANLQIFLTLLTELSRLLFVTIDDVEHEEDLRRIRPLKTVVLCQRAVNCYKNADCRGHDLHNLRKTARPPSTVTALLVNGPDNSSKKRMPHWRAGAQRTLNVFGLKLLAMSVAWKRQRQNETLQVENLQR